MEKRQRLPKEFFLRDDVVKIAEQLIGKVICTNFRNQYTSGIITETEAYTGYSDKGSHTYNGRKTKRTEVMYRAGGVAYIYLCYGIHHLFNMVCNQEGVAQGVLIRSVKPLEGIDIMLKRRNKKKQDKILSSGPGTLSQALGIKSERTGMSLQSDELWVEDRDIRIAKSNIVIGSRVGIDYAEEDAHLPYRFRVKNLNEI